MHQEIDKDDVNLGIDDARSRGPRHNWRHSETVGEHPSQTQAWTAVWSSNEMRGGPIELKRKSKNSWLYKNCRLRDRIVENSNASAAQAELETRCEWPAKSRCQPAVPQDSEHEEPA